MNADDRNVRNNELWQQWIAARIEEIHRRVSAHDVLERHGVKLRYQDREEQISCPFHGRDNRPSARIYPSNGDSPSSVWCFVCNERWDCISLWKKLEQIEDQKFGAILRSIEEAYHIEVPERPSELKEPSGPDPMVLEYEGKLEMCENRLQQCRSALDMMTYLRIGVVLDRIRYQVTKKIMTPQTALEGLTKVLDKIREKEASYEEVV